MPSILACPEENELLVLAMGEPAAPAITAHAAGCSRCQRALKRLAAEIAQLRANRPEMALAPSTYLSTAGEATTDPDDAASLVGHAGATANWESRDPVGDHVSLSTTETANNNQGHGPPRTRSRPRSTNTWWSAGFLRAARRRSWLLMPNPSKR
jgi:hypothetical protein